jgi:hypothetical protein
MIARLNKALARSFASVSLVFSCVALLSTVRATETFNDDQWISLGGSPGANSGVNASVVDASGNLYIGGSFTHVGETKANYVAKWDGSSALTMPFRPELSTLQRVKEPNPRVYSSKQGDTVGFPVCRA